MEKCWETFQASCILYLLLSLPFGLKVVKLARLYGKEFIYIESFAYLIESEIDSNAQENKPKKCVLLYSFVYLLILSGQLLISINFHPCFYLSSMRGVRYSANDLAMETATYTYICLCSSYILPMCVLSTIHVSSSHISSGATRQCAYASSGCGQKKITLYRNFFRNLNFKNIVIFFKRACCVFANIYTFKNILIVEKLRVSTSTFEKYCF